MQKAHSVFKNVFYFHLLLIRCSWVCFGCTLVPVILLKTARVSCLVRDMRLSSGLALIYRRFCSPNNGSIEKKK